MEIRWYGQACFLIKTAGENKEEVKLLFDVFSDEIGIKTPSEESEILLLSNCLKVKSLPKHRLLINEQGEYEAKNVFIKAISINEDLIYIIESEDLRICHLGAFSAKELTPEQIEEIGEVDVLTIPVGGGDVITGAEALKIVNQIEPKIIVPSCFNIPKLKVKLEEVDGFLKAIGQAKPEAEGKLSVSKEKLPDKTTVVILKAN
jgi:L-ascorbate metabolism protein UlaG (beta-lactamase superfamily)